MDAGDFFRALAWFASALAEETGGPPRHEVHRRSLAGLLHGCPRLEQVWALKHSPSQVMWPSRRMATTSWQPIPPKFGICGTSGRERTSRPEQAAAPWFGALPMPSFSADGQAMLSFRGPQVVKTLTQAPLSPALDFQGQPSGAFFSPGGDRVLITETASPSHLFVVKTGKRSCPPLRHAGPVTFAALSPDSRRLVAVLSGASHPGLVEIWDTTTGKLVFPPLRHGNLVRRVALSPDGRRLITAGHGDPLIWDVATGQRVGQLRGNKNVIDQVAFSPEGNRIVTASQDGTARVWDAHTGQQQVILRHKRMVNQAVFSPDGLRVLTASHDGSARVWDALTGHPETPPLWHAGAVLQVAFTPDGFHAVTAGEDRLAAPLEGCPLATCCLGTRPPQYGLECSLQPRRA